MTADPIALITGRPVPNYPIPSSPQSGHGLMPKELTRQQVIRVRALRQAFNLLKAGAPAEEVTVANLLTLARWIVDGDSEEEPVELVDLKTEDDSADDQEDDREQA